MAVVLPHNFTAGTLASAQQVDDNFAAVVEAIEGVGAASTASDVYQGGAVALTDWLLAERSINAATGELTFTNATGAAWLPGESSGLTRTFTPPTTFKVKPGSLPAAGGFMNVGVELTDSGAEASLSVVSGVEQISQAAAEANPHAVSAGKVRIANLILRNVGGVYSILAFQDQRPWALGRAVAGPFVSRGSSWIAQYGESAQSTATCTATMPTAVGHSGESVELWNAEGVLTVNSKGGTFYGDAFWGAATLTLLRGQHVKFRSNGTNWLIVAGGPQSSTAPEGRVERARNTLFTPDALRPTEVLLHVELPGAPLGGTILWLDGVETAIGFTSDGHVSFWCKAGQTWEIRGGTAETKIFSTYNKW